jgi:glycosyltransferase involved in cell wall biosynthesis
MTGTGAPVAVESATLVVPCFNEADRLTDAAFADLVETDAALSLIFVDDGSTDGTAGRLAALCARRPRQLAVHTLDRNSGKAEAVRLGLLQALEGGAAIVGYFDADLATPVTEIRRLLAILRSRSAIAALLASRVALLGRQIERRHARHYLGRVFATAASAFLQLRVYDTQCGAKLFRRNAAIAAALARPFRSRWVFDVELLGRLLVGDPPAVAPLDPACILEEPLLVWRDVSGSKLRAWQMVRAAADLMRVGLEVRRRRALPTRADGRVSSS